MKSDTPDAQRRSVWEPQPVAARLVASQIDHFCWANPQIHSFAERLREQSGTRLIDWIDTIVLPLDSAWGLQSAELVAAGFEPVDEASNVWANHLGIFPAVTLAEPRRGGARHALLFRVDDVDTLCRKFPADPADIVGRPGSALRSVEVSRHDDVALVAVERHGWRGLEGPDETEQQIRAAHAHAQAFAARRRDFAVSGEGFAHAAELIQAAVDDLGTARACDLFFAAERAYWMSRNHAARVQYSLQQQLGLGWANHDHHTFRSSRDCFHLLVKMLETLGFSCRERFYAGEEAGWGAQVLEQAEARFVVFADVDMSANEVAGDFSHEGLQPRGDLGTVGLWCRLHGESFLQAGMHHLECQFDFDAARELLTRHGVETMAPFTDFPFLRQAFTAGEVWPVEPQRIQTAVDAGQITEEQARQFRQHGAIGSHLEILERNDGYKGFNQTGVSDIISRTDPRRW
ncbi:MAG: hypothetical protein R3C10_25490 [Pirellulales bacterium]